MMHKTRLWVALVCGLFAITVFAWAGTGKAGLWEITTTTKWQRSPFAPGTAGDPARGGTHTTQVCLTQEMIDDYGALLPQSRGQCTIANKLLRPGGMTADWVCTGKMAGKGALESNWSDLEHATGKVHFVGTLQVGGGKEPVEWTTESTSVFKSADCGSVKPVPLPEVRH
jgi:hypothetical protein